MNKGSIYLKQGKEYLTKHQPEKAVESFKAALETCPVEDTRQLDKILFYFGISLKKIGFLNGAAKCWIIAQKVNKKAIQRKCWIGL